MKRSLLLGAALALSCSRITVPECSVLCGSGHHCSLGVCGQDGYCHSSPKSAQCPGLEVDLGAAGPCLGCVDPTSGPYNYVFVTSETYVPGELGGLAGADAKCQGLADAAKLPGHFKAWLSTQAVDVKSRFAAARGFIRPDGRPFADSIQALSTSIEIFYPPRIDELKNDQVNAEAGVATGSNADGTARSGTTCGDWADTSPTHYPASASSGTTAWAVGFNSEPCSSPARLYCFGVDYYQPLVFPKAEGRTAFLSATAFTPGGGLSGADALCANDAMSNGIAGTFRALLATANSSAAGRLADGGPWVRPDGVVWTASRSELVASHPLSTLNVLLDGSHDIGVSHIWTGAIDPGTDAAPGNNCRDWSSAASGDSGYTGSFETSGPDFFYYGGLSFSCDNGFKVYCLEN